MKKSLFSVCLVLLLLLCACGQKAVTLPTSDTPPLSEKQETPIVTPAAETPESENLPAETAEKVTEKVITNAENPVSADTAAAKPEPKSVSETKQPDTSAPPETSKPTATQPSTTEPTEPTSDTPPTQSSAASCTISILCSTAVGKSDAAPANGIILSTTTVTLSGNESVYDVLCAVCSENAVSLSGSSGYIKSIGGLAERDCGGGSGWLYRVNGTTPGVGCGSYTVVDGDCIEWLYTCEMGNDL